MFRTDADLGHQVITVCDMKDMSMTFGTYFSYRMIFPALRQKTAFFMLQENFNRKYQDLNPWHFIIIIMSWMQPNPTQCGKYMQKCLLPQELMDVFFLLMVTVYCAGGSPYKDRTFLAEMMIYDLPITHGVWGPHHLSLENMCMKL